MSLLQVRSPCFPLLSDVFHWTQTHTFSVSQVPNKYLISVRYKKVPHMHYTVSQVSEDTLFIHILSVRYLFVLAFTSTVSRVTVGTSCRPILPVKYQWVSLTTTVSREPVGTSHKLQLSVVYQLVHILILSVRNHYVPHTTILLARYQ